VLTVIMENHSLNQMIADMPYLYGLAERFSYATGYAAITHPSLPDYLAIAGGDTFGVTDDAPPSAHPISGDSIFDQAVTAGLTGRTYNDAMTSNCQLKSSGRYAVKHNPHAYFNGSAQRANCQANNVPAGTPTAGQLHDDLAAGQLPNAGMLVPDLCNDAHDCPLSTADSYLQSWLPRLMAGPDYQAGRLAIVVTGDEDNGSQGNKVLTVVVHPSLDGAHKVVATNLTHYSLTRLYDQVLGAPPLRNAAGAPDMRAAFNLP
jgi:acid phosphatase